jgi:hypothetical protein
MSLSQEGTRRGSLLGHGRHDERFVRALKVLQCAKQLPLSIRYLGVRKEISAGEL